MGRDKDERCIVEHWCAGYCPTCEASIVDKGIGGNGEKYRTGGSNYVQI